jgi:hypothetical protein
MAGMGGVIGWLVGEDEDKVSSQGFYFGLNGMGTLKNSGLLWVISPNWVGHITC